MTILKTFPCTTKLKFVLYWKSLNLHFSEMNHRNTHTASNTLPFCHRWMLILGLKVQPLQSSSWFSRHQMKWSSGPAVNTDNSNNMILGLENEPLNELRWLLISLSVFSHLLEILSKLTGQVNVPVLGEVSQGLQQMGISRICRLHDHMFPKYPANNISNYLSFNHFHPLNISRII